MEKGGEVMYKCKVGTLLVATTHLSTVADFDGIVLFKQENQTVRAYEMKLTDAYGISVREGSSESVGKWGSWECYSAAQIDKLLGDSLAPLKCTK